MLGTTTLDSLKRRLADRPWWTGAAVLLAAAGAALLASRLAGLLHGEAAHWSLPAATLALVAAASLLIATRIPRPVSKEAQTGVGLLDPLTRLPNREAFHSHLDACLSATGVQADDIAVIYADLDHFKEVNDSLGHNAGDALLEEVSTRFSAVLRKGELLARIGGDEFALVLSGARALERAEETAARMIEAVQQPISVKGYQIPIGVSLGISFGRGGELSAEELIRRADVALYRAKGESRLCFRRFDPVMDEASSNKRAMRNDLERALVEGQLRVALQPVFDARTGQLASAEALMRWSHPERGDVPPSRFIPLAEETGQIFEISAFALREALASAKELATVPIAVNVSPLQFRSRGFPRFVADNLLEVGVSPDLLKIEITEGVLIRHTEAARATLRQLREMGVQVVLDDFGTGYSSLSYLQDFAFDAMKIDRSFLRHLGAMSQSTQLMRAIIDLGHSLGMKVVAEGIENAWQTSVLQLLGCDYLQGFFLGLPVDPASLQLCGPIDVSPATPPESLVAPKSSQQR